MLLNDLLGELAFGFVVVDPVTGDGRELPASVVLIMDVIRHVLEVLHVGSDTKHLILENGNILYKDATKYKDGTATLKVCLSLYYCVSSKHWMFLPDEHIPQECEVTVVSVLNCAGRKENPV